MRVDISLSGNRYDHYLGLGMGRHRDQEDAGKEEPGYSFIRNLFFVIALRRPSAR
jgi:hypothetical protein